MKYPALRVCQVKQVQYLDQQTIGNFLHNGGSGFADWLNGNLRRFRDQYLRSWSYLEKRNNPSEIQEHGCRAMFIAVPAIWLA
jgi:hypothetical protein